MMFHHDVRSPFLSLFLLVLSFLLFRISRAEYLHKYPFLYATEDDVNASFPVIEHLSREYRADFLQRSESIEKDDSSIDDEEEDQPDFLYKHEEQGYRIVEYYVHWCSTCKLFSSVYRSFAIKIREIAAWQGIQENIHIYAVSCSPNRKLCVNQNVKGFPKIRLYKPGESDYTELVHHSHLHPLRVLEALGIDSDGMKNEIDAGEDWDMESAMKTQGRAEVPSPSSYLTRIAYFFTGKELVGKSNSVVELRKYPRRSREELKADIYLSFDYALRNEIYRSADGLSEKQQQVFRDWLDLLIHTLPSSWEIHKLLKELMNNFIYIAKSEDYLMALLDEYPAPAQSWSPSCSYGIPDEGYTCGLWELFHTVTVGVVEYNKATFDPQKLLVTELTARKLRDYIDHFFGCLTCRDNFLEMFDNCGFNRCDRLSDYPIEDENDWIELPLWLHETHNYVNVRLMKERAARNGNDVTTKDVIEVMWPLRQECSECWKDGASLDVTDELPWRSDNLFKFLRLEYGSRDAYSADVRRALNPDPKTTDSHVSSASGSEPIVSSNPRAPILRKHSDAPLLIQLSHASVFVVCIVLLNAAMSTRKMTRRKLKVG